MKVWVEGKLYDAEQSPMLLVLTDGDKANIAAMPAAAHKFGIFRKGSLSPIEIGILMSRAGEQSEDKHGNVP